MRLTHRDLEPADIDACFARLSNSRAYDCYRPSLRECVPRVWTSLLGAGGMQGDVVLDLDRPTSSRVVGFGAGVFVTDAFVSEAQTIMPPYVRAQLVERVLQGNSPVLSSSEIRANGSGLNLFIIEDMFHNPELSAEDLRTVMNKGIEAGLSRFRCYRLRSWLSEAYGFDGAQKFEMAGAAIWRDYADYFSHASNAPESCERPYLMGINCEEAVPRDGTVLSMLFLHTPRYFFFRPVEQEVLRLALHGETDEELASSLNVSLSAIKKRWSGIYERVDLTDPTLIPLDSVSESIDRKRGAEKRRHLLNYLREHPEELQPNVP